MNALELKGLRKSFGKTEIIRGVDLAVKAGERIGVIGPNGAGKSTLFNLISGRLEPTSGEVLLNGKRIDGLKPYEINRLGLSRSFQITNIFPKLSVFENLRCGVLWSLGYKYTFLKFLADLDDANERAEELMTMIKLDKKHDVLAMNLTYAEQRALEIGITIAGGASVVLLDENHRLIIKRGYQLGRHRQGPGAGPLPPARGLRLHQLEAWLRPRRRPHHRLLHRGPRADHRLPRPARRRAPYPLAGPGTHAARPHSMHSDGYYFGTTLAKRVDYFAFPRTGSHFLWTSFTGLFDLVFFANQLPMTVSVEPQVSAFAGTEYISAASRKLTPRTSERSRMAWASASLTCSPKVMVPRQMGVTCRPLWPRVTWFMDG